MIRAMKRVYLLYTQDRQEELVTHLQKLGLLHLEESRLEDPSERATEGRLAEDRRRVENLLIKARGILELFAEVDPKLLRVKPEEALKHAPRLEELTQAFREELESLEGRLRALVSERRELRDRQNAGERFREIVQTSQELLKALPAPEHEIIAMIGEARKPTGISEIEKTLQAQIPGRFQLASRELSEDRVEVLVSVDPEYAPAVREYIEAKGLRPIALPPHIETGFVEGISQLHAEQTTIPRRLQELESELRGLASKHAGRMIALTTALENRLAQLDAAARFGYTRYTLLISGWVPADELNNLHETLRRAFPDIIIQEDPATFSYEEIPVAFKHRPWVKPYQLFMDAFGTPKHGSVDPVPYISIFFPIFFGIIIGDIGYGLTILALALWGLRGFPGLKIPLLEKLAQSEGGRSALRVLRDGGGFSMVLGFLFGEFFGLEFEQLGIHPVPIGPLTWPFSRLHHAIDLLLFTVALGAVQVLLGFLFGIVIALRHKDTKHLLAKIGLVFSLLGIALVVGSLMRILPDAYLPGVIILGMAFPLLMYGGGVIVVVEALSPFIHVLSYARIMGFGVASVVLAALFNSAVGGLSTMGNIILGAILGALVALVLHTVNLVLHVFEGTIQSARLHWVEFFQKFLLEQLGGKPYKPFKEKEFSTEP